MEKWGLKELREHLLYIEKLELDRIAMISDQTKLEINFRLSSNIKRKKMLSEKVKKILIEYLLSIYKKKIELKDSWAILKFIEDMKILYEKYLSEYKTDEELNDCFERTLKGLMAQYFYLLPEKDKSVN